MAPLFGCFGIGFSPSRGREGEKRGGDGTIGEELYCRGGEGDNFDSFYPQCSCVGRGGGVVGGREVWGEWRGREEGRRRRKKSSVVFFCIFWERKQQQQ